MDIITRHQGYEYVSLILATTFLVPQAVHSYYTKRMNDVSSVSLTSVAVSSVLWATYMHENGLQPQMAATLFVTANAVWLLAWKAYLAFVEPPLTVEVC